MTATVNTITPSPPETQSCMWCGESCSSAWLPNRKGAATFIYVCSRHEDQAERALFERVGRGEQVFARKSAKTPPKR